MSDGPIAGREAESGYALVAAVACILLFATIALTVMAAARISIESGRGEITNARARLAADAGTAFALHGLIAGDEAMVSALDGRPVQLDFGNARITIHLADERGKIPINHIEAPAIERMLEHVGLSGASLAIARDSLLDWQDPDDEPLPDGAEAPAYAATRVAPRNGALLTVDELGAIRGFSPGVVAALRPYVTADPAVLLFDPRYAQPAAIAVMTGGGAGSVTAIERQREEAGQRTAFAFISRKALVGRPVTISVYADTSDRGHFHRETTIVVTNDPAHPYVVHAVR